LISETLRKKINHPYMSMNSSNSISNITVNLSTVAFLLMAFTSCKKSDGVPTLGQVSGTGGSIKPREVTIQSSVLTDGGNKVTERGFCYGNNPKPTISDSKAIDGSSSTSNSFTLTIKGLKSNTTYYFRSYALNSKGVGYSSSDLEVTTPAYIMTASVGGNPYTATVFGVGTSSDGRYTFEGQGASNSILLYLPANNVSIGTFQMVKNSNYDAKYSDGVKTYSLKAGTGSITISEASSSGKIKGTFSFTAEDLSSAGAPTKVITNGTFETYK
jgi:hypothetical protein